MQSIVHTKIIQINIVLSVSHLFYLLLAIKLSIASLHFKGLKPIRETLCLYSYILTPSFIHMTSRSTNFNTDRIIEIDK